MVSFLLKEINPHSLRLINITLLFITSWNSSSRFSFYFLFQKKFETCIYVFLFNTIKYFIYKSGSTLHFWDNSLHVDIYYDEWRSCFLLWELLEQLFFRDWSRRSISYSSALLNTLSFMYSYLTKSTSFELSWGTLLVTLYSAGGMAIPFRNLKGKWLSSQCSKLLMTQCWQDQGLL